MGGEWESRRLADVATVVMGQSPPGATYNEEGRGLPFFQGVKDFSNRYPRKRVYCTAPTRFAEPGDILFSVRAPIGEINRAAERCCIGRGLAAIRGQSKYDTDYLEYVLRSIRDEWHILEGQGAVFGNAKKSDLENLIVPWPEEEERRAIAHILGTLDDKIELNRRMNETLEAIAQALFKSWFVDFDPVVVNALKAGNPIPDKFAERAAHFHENPDALGLPEHILRLFPDRFVESELGPIPEGWEVKTLGSICHRPQYGYTASANENRVGPKFLRIKDINKLPWINWREVPYCTISDEQQHKYLLRAGDVVIARIADPGHGALIEEQVEAIFASYLIRFRPVYVTYDRYLQYWLRSEPYWQLVKGRQSGSTRANLNAKVLGVFPLVVPDLRGASAFRQIIGSMRERVVANVREENTLATLRDTLLPKLISGELRVPDVEKILEGVE